MKTAFICLCAALTVTSNGLSLAQQSNLTAVYSDSGRKLDHVQRSDTGEKLMIASPLWLVTTEDDGLISSVDFEPIGKFGNNPLFKHQKSGLTCSLSTVAGRNFIRHSYTFQATRPVVIEKLTALALGPDFNTGGDVPGSPLINGNFFAGMEFPTAQTLARLKNQIGKWDPSMLEPKIFKELKYSLPDKMVQTADSIDIQFIYHSGWSRLDIRRVAVFKGDQLIAEDTHDGFTGTPSRNNTYHLDLNSLDQNQKTGLHVIADVMLQGESHGVVSLHGAKTDLITQYIPCNRKLMPDESMTYSSIIGHAVSGSLRRGVLEYLEASRARKYQPFLHYNSWYDIADQGSDGLHVMDSDQCLEVMNAWHKDFMKPYNIKMDCFVFDDGWDDFDNLWSFHPERFPQGFAPQAALAKKINTNIGTWFSPFGGYGATKTARLASAQKAGYEINSSGLSLSGPKYYKLFYDKTAQMINKYQVNSFKFDGVGGGPSTDMEAAYRLMSELRQIKPDLYINLTTGTWGSPFFLLHGDSIWRGGGDANTWGDKGPMTHRWLIYRDGETYNNIVKKSPLFPLNSLMLCGMVYSRLGLGRTSVDKTDKSFADQAYSFFATGTQLQELYMSQAVMTKKKWDILAAAIKWSHANTETLRDTHWVGGDPYKYQVYGHASFDYRGTQKDQPYKAIVSLRNPSEKTVDFELPLTDITEWDMQKVKTWKISRKVYSQAQTTIDKNSLKFKIEPFSVELLELAVTPQ